MAINEIVVEPEVEVNRETARENRKATGRQVALMIALFIILIALYHVWLRKNSLLTGIFVPAFIMILYGVWVVHTSKRDKRRRQAEELAKKDQEVAAQEEVTLKKQQAFSNPAAVSFVSNPSTSKVILIHPMSRDSRDPRDSKISSKSITLRNDLKTPTQPHSHQKQHGAKGIQSIQPTPSIEIRQIPPFKKVQSQNQLTNNLLPTVHLKNEKTKKSRSLEKKNLAESAANKS